MRNRITLLYGAARDLGTTTAEYAIVILVAVTFAGTLLAIMRGGVVTGLLTGLVKRALSFA